LQKQVILFSCLEFDRWSKKSNIEPVTKSIDPLAIVNELTLKCSLPCPANLTTCYKVANGTNVLWYSGSNLIFNNSLVYNEKTRLLYSFLSENIWTNYTNNDVKILKIKTSFIIYFQLTNYFIISTCFSKRFTANSPLTMIFPQKDSMWRVTRFILVSSVLFKILHSKMINM
jgi:hypothetical protein